MLISLLLLLASIAGCNSNTEMTAPSGKIAVVVGISPHKFLVDQIGGDNVAVSTLVSPGQSSHTFEPTPRQTAELAKAQFFFRTGEPFEEGLIRKIVSSFPNVAVVDMRNGIVLREHGHAHDGAESHGDPHIYLSPILLKIQAHTVFDCLSRLLPNKQIELTTNRDRLFSQLDSLDSAIRTILAPYNGDTILVYHSAFGYFADDYGLVQLAVESEGKEPGAKDLGELIELAQRLHVRTIFVQPQYSAKSAETLAEAIGARVQNLDPLREDVIQNLREIALALQSELATRRSKSRKESNVE